LMFSRPPSKIDALALPEQPLSSAEAASAQELVRYFAVLQARH